jgi:hypothetical protein
MDQLQGLSFGRKLVLGGGVLLLISTFLNWQSIEVFGADFGRNAWHGFWGVVMGLMTIAILVWVLARAFGMNLPGEAPEAAVALALGVLIFLFALIKNLADDYSAWPSYVGVVLAAVVAYGAWLNYQATGEGAPARMSEMTAGAGPAASTAPPPAPVDRTDGDPGAGEST